MWQCPHFSAELYLAAPALLLSRVSLVWLQSLPLSAVALVLPKNHVVALLVAAPRIVGGVTMRAEATMVEVALTNLLTHALLLPLLHRVPTPDLLVNASLTM